MGMRLESLLLQFPSPSYNCYNHSREVALHLVYNFPRHLAFATIMALFLTGHRTNAAVTE